MDTTNIIDSPDLPQIKRPKSLSWSTTAQKIFYWLSTWEIYPILFLTAFLRFYHLPLTEFDEDQALLFSLPREAFLHGLIPATGVASSIRMLNPPGYVYLLLPITTFTANPLADAIFTALLNVLAVLLTYIFVRRYYGRLAGTIAALLYATTIEGVFFSRFIWQPNLLPFFTVLLMLALFWGAVERRSGWLMVALPLLGLMLQLHTTSIYMAVPLAIALLLAFKTVRWRDLIVGGLLFVLMFSTYFIWLLATHFSDLQLLLAATGGHAHIDTQGITQYLNFLMPYVSTNSLRPNTPATSAPQSLLPHFMLFLHLGKLGMYIVIFGAFLLAILGVSGWGPVRIMNFSRFPASDFQIFATNSLWQKIQRWWNILAASPQRRSLLLLLSWQIVPLLLFLRHSIALQPQYFMIFLPGPFILIGIFFSQIASWCGASKDLSKLLRFVTVTISLLLICLQLLGSLGWLLDEVHGYHDNGNGYNSLQDIESAVNTADQLAQSRHLQHVYITAGSDLTYFSLRYLASEMKTPVTLLSDPYATWKYLQGQVYVPPSSSSNCLILPSPSQGPAIMLLEPDDQLDIALLTHFARATLVSKPPRLGGQPFLIYIVQPLASTSDSQVSFAHTLALSTQAPGIFTNNQSALLETHWTNLQNLPAKYGITYNYHFVAQASHGGATSTVDCNFTSITPGEQLLVPFHLPTNNAAQSTSLSLSGSIRITKPITLHYGSLSFESALYQRDVLAPFQTSAGGENIVVQS